VTEYWSIEIRTALSNALLVCCKDLTQTNAQVLLAEKIVINFYSDLIFSRDATRGKKLSLCKV
jgi:hypothetical protein